MFQCVKHVYSAARGGLVADCGAEQPDALKLVALSPFALVCSQER